MVDAGAKSPGCSVCMFVCVCVLCRSVVSNSVTLWTVPVSFLYGIL